MRATRERSEGTHRSEAGEEATTTISDRRWIHEDDDDEEEGEVGEFELGGVEGEAVLVV